MIQCLAHCKYSRLVSTVFASMILHHNMIIVIMDMVSVYTSTLIGVLDNFLSHNFQKSS